MKKKQPNQSASQKDFWRGKTPCWEITLCPDIVRDDCPAYHCRVYPCWEIEGTYCKWNDWGTHGRDTEICLSCPVYLEYGSGRPIKIKLQGRGIKLLINH